MKFKRHWGFIWQMVMIIVIILLLGIITGICFCIQKDYTAAKIFVAISVLFAVLIYAAMRILPYDLHDTVSIDENGIALRSGIDGNLSFLWKNVAKIDRSRKYGTNTLVVTEMTGKNLWFYSSRKIERYISMYYKF